jgi:hypothetical protein
MVTAFVDRNPNIERFLELSWAYVITLMIPLAISKLR